jgi:hypothetical protein
MRYPGKPKVPLLHSGPWEGDASMNINPILAVAIDSSRRKKVQDKAAIIRTIAPHRSIRDARLKNNHYTTMASPPRSPSNTPITIVLGSMKGRTNRTIH